MKSERPPIRAAGVIFQILDGNLYRVAMPNGYEVLAPVDRSIDGETFQEREVVELEFSPYNMRQARIMGPLEG